MKFKLEWNPEPPSVAEVRRWLRRELDTWVRSYREKGGVVRDYNAIHAIVRLRVALKLLPKK